MKTIIRNVLFVSLLSAGMFTIANAQRGGRFSSGSRSYRGSYGRGGAVSRPSGIYNRGYAGGYAGGVYRGSVYGGYRPVYSHAPVVFRGGYSPYFGPRYYGVPRGSISIHFGGYPYYYYGGTFYRPFGGYYRSIFPPIGLQIGILPPGYFPFYLGQDPYYFYNGTYYRPYDNGYQVVDAPMGAQVPNLPQGAKSVSVNGEKFYELNGTYYKEDRDAHGNEVYTVVGKNGEINNTDQGGQPQSATPKVGDTVSQLPANSRTITLNGQTLYVSPDDTYYRAENDGTYTVVGVAGSLHQPSSYNNAL